MSDTLDFESHEKEIAYEAKIKGDYEHLVEVNYDFLIESGT